MPPTEPSMVTQPRPARVWTPASVRWFGAAALFSMLAGCQADRSAPESPPETEATAWFVDRTGEAGLEFTHFNGMSGEFYFPENMAPGVGLFDYDGDGDLDAFVVQGQILAPGGTLADAILPPQGPLPPRSRLFRNDLTVDADGDRTLRFVDVTESSGIDTAGRYGMGVATGDFSNNGCVDVYVTHYGPNQLFRNNCDGTFVEVSEGAGVADPAWGVSAAFFDYDRDGWLDLYVGNYLRYTLDNHRACARLARSGVRDYCPPQLFDAVPDKLYRNLGNGTFDDVTERAGLTGAYGRALGVVSFDANLDGWPDVYVANDGEENQLWINQGDGSFRDRGLVSGSSLSSDGMAEASMGVDAGDFDNDGDEDLFVTHLPGEGHNLYANDGAGAFSDLSAQTGIGPTSLPYSGFGAGWTDIDSDGWLDLLTVNGSIIAIEAQAREGDPFPRRQRKQLLRNLATGRFEDVTDQAGPALQSLDNGRGAAFGDIDNDGDIDVLVGNTAGRLQLLLNEAGGSNHWLGLRLVGSDAPRDMLGAIVEVVVTGEESRWRSARTASSYASANDPRVHVGLGQAADPPRVRVQWPSGGREEWVEVPIDRWATLVEGTGE